MAMVVKVVLDNAAIARLNSESGMIGMGMRRAAGRVRDRAKQNIETAGRTNTGALKQSIYSAKVVQAPTGITWRVGSNLFYARYQHEGVGPIYPRRARVLRFKPKGSNTFIFRPSTSGFEGVPYLTDALRTFTAMDLR